MKLKHLLVVLLAFAFTIQGLATDTDSDGMTDDYETSQGYDPNTYTKVVYVDNAKADDTGDGLSLSTAKKTISAAVGISQDLNYENVILVAAGTYTGANNRNIDFGGFDIKLRSSAGAETTIIDLESSGRFLYLGNGETQASWLDGFTIKNGYINGDHGGSIYLYYSDLIIKNNIFENCAVDGDNTSNGSQCGGVIFSGAGDVELINNKFINCSSEEYGGAIVNSYSNMTIKNSDFIGNSALRGGAIMAASASTLVLEKCKFSENTSSENGGVFYLGVATFDMTNCLVNNSYAGGSYAFMWCNSGTNTVNIMNSTLYGFTSTSGYDINVRDFLNVTNSIFRATVSGTPTSINNCCTLTDMSTYGTGNFTTEPKINVILGSLLTGSPCIDTGTDNNAPTEDMDGTARPAGYVDVGCYEFIDTDGDGIPDNIETAVGMNPAVNDASGDIDGDSISNIDEYSNGTDPGSPDSDGDGINDGVEVANGYDPTVRTKVVYVDLNRPDDTGDGLSLSTAKKTISAAVGISQDLNYENVILVAAGTYTGANNRNIDFGGFDIKLRSSAGAETTIIDLESSGRFLYLGNGETQASWLDGFTIKNGYINGDHGGSIQLYYSDLIIKNCILEDSNIDGSYVGGAIYSGGNIVEIINTKFINCSSANGTGGAIANSHGHMTIKNCDFIGNNAWRAGAIMASSISTLILDKCKFSENTSSENGGVFCLGVATFEMTNCLVNNSYAGGSYAFMWCTSGTNTVNIMNSTLYGFTSTSGYDINVRDFLNVTNSIFRATVSGTPTSINNCCTLTDMSTYGTGNFTTEPKINVILGSLLTGSPCIDTGTDNNAPTEDMDGTARPAGYVDVGCYEFIDTDGDGIPDNIETAVGMNPAVNDASGDIDGDSISNIDEYSNGTDPGSPDSDGDGINDGVEVANGYDPTVRTKVVYVDLNRPDDTGDGLSLSTAKKTISAAVGISQDLNYENVILVAAGTYTGANNRNIDFGGFDIKLRSSAGAETTIIDLESSGRFLYLGNGETQASWLDGFTIKNGYINGDHGGSIQLYYSDLIIKNCILEDSNIDGSYVGGAIYSGGNIVEIINTKFINCSSANGTGGAIANSHGHMTIKNCDFIGNNAWRAGAIMASSISTLILDKCKFSENTSSENGGVFCLGVATFEMTNCLVNNSYAGGSYAFMWCTSGTNTVNIMNSTLYGFTSTSGYDINVRDFLNVTNSIFRATVSGAPNSINNSCTLTDMSAYGTGNFTTEPQLTGTGYLLANSPCINAGTSIGAPTTDMDDISRPQGAGVDIGCYEYIDTDGDGLNDGEEINIYNTDPNNADSDGDGIPDGFEISFSLNPNDASDASGDIDNDGITNLAEYQNGTNPGSTDSDSDGIADNTELELGYDPAVSTKLVYVDASRPDDTGDGLSLATAKKTISAAVGISQDTNYENVILVAAGTYTGANNRDIDFGGFDIKLRSINGAETTIIDLENADRFLHLDSGETKASWLDGFTVKNGYYSGSGGIISLAYSELAVKNCIFRDSSVSGTGASYAGAINSCAGSIIDIINCKFINCSAEEYGGAVSSSFGQMSIVDCDFIGNSAEYGGAIITAGSTLTLEYCKFNNNSCSQYGGVFYVDGSTVSMTNCLVSDSSSTNNYAFMYVHSNWGTNSDIDIVNSTLYGFASHNGTDMNLIGTLNVTNSIFKATVSGTPTSVLNSCTLTDMSAYGTGNFTTDPKLNVILGSLQADSPCIDTGTYTGGPSDDLDGTSRPQGSGVDIGCYEFIDTDGDGIPDNIETAAGMDPTVNDANGDIDGDSISNIDEYLNGTDPGSPDSDGDGINDGVEVANNYDPTIYTKVVYVDNAQADDSGDGLTLATAKKTISAAVGISQDTNYENVILVAAGTYTGANNRDIDFGGFDIKLRSINGAETTIIDLENADRFLHLDSGETKASWLDGFTVKNGYYSGSGGIISLAYSELAVKNCIFRDSSVSGTGASYAGAINSCAGSIIDIINCKFINCSAEEYGGAVSSSFGQMSIVDCDFIGNSAEYGGAIITAGSTLTLEYCKFNNNSCSQYGGVFYVDGSTVSMTNCLVSDSSSTNNYAFMYVHSNWGTNSDIDIVNSTLYGFASHNGTDMNLIGTLNVTNSIFKATVSGTPTSVLNSCTLTDMSAYGTGNFTTEPQLTGTGYLLANSPCINAGTSIGAPTTDMDDISRPQGAGVDIGCYEYIDTDGDGLNDGEEINIYNTDPNNADQDGDGWIDGLEIDCYGNLDNTPNDDNDNDGFSNFVEYILELDKTKTQASSTGLNLIVY